MEIVEQAGEESEERLLLERRTLLLMVARKDEYNDGHNLRHIVHLGMMTVPSSRITVILDDIDDEACQGIQCLESVGKLPGSDAFVIGVYTGLHAHSEEE